MMQDTTKLESELWEAADQLRANSKLTATEYSMPVLGLIFLRHATTRYNLVKAEIEKTLPSRGGVTRPLTPSDFKGRAALFLPEEAQYQNLVSLPESVDVGQALVTAMTKIEEEDERLKGAMPKTYARFEPDLLRRLLRIFNREALHTASGDVFGRIYEYFLNKFAMSGAQEGGEFFTPPSLVRMIVNVIEPRRGIIFDPAVGSAGMFVQTGYFLLEQGTIPANAVTFYGQEKTDTNTNLARMNMAVHGLEGDIQQGNTFYDRRPELIGRCDAVMANPPFNVDGVDPDRVINDPRLFTTKKIPGINQKNGGVSNANYLWIQYFYSYLNDTGRAGFVMAASATDAGHGEKAIRQEIINTGHVDVIIAIGTNFFYTRSLPCTLWFFDKGKPASHLDKVLMLDARPVYHVVSRKIRDFTEEQLHNLTAIVWLYRGETDRFLALVNHYLNQTQAALVALPDALQAVDTPLTSLQTALCTFAAQLHPTAEITPEIITAFQTQVNETLAADIETFQADRAALLTDLSALPDFTTTPAHNQAQHQAHDAFLPFVARLKALQKTLISLVKEINRLRDEVEKGLNGRQADQWDNRITRADMVDLEHCRDAAVQAMKDTLYFFNQVTWLQTRFPEGAYTDVVGLCKAVSLNDIHGHDDSLTPGRYVGVALVEEEDDDDFEERMYQIYTEIELLSEEANELTASIKAGFEEIITL